MDQTVTSRVVVVVVVVICSSLLSADEVTTLPLQSCSSVINHVNSVITAGHQPVHPGDISLYFACLGVQQQQVSDDNTERQLLALQPNTDVAAHTGWPSLSRVVCNTVDCLGQRAALTFEPCLRLSPRQCLALVGVLENIISTTNSKADNDDAAARLLEYFRLLFSDYQRWRQSDDTRKKRLEDMTSEEAVRKNDRNTGSLFKSGGNEKDDGRISSLVASDAGAPRIRRSVVPQGIPFSLPERMTPEARAIVASYLAWRAQNGYGRVSGRWG